MPKVSQPLARTYNIKSYGGWPKNDGFVTKTRGVLPPGAKLSRIGDDSGRFVSPKGTPFTQRSLPRGSERMATTNYKVVKPIPNWHGQAAPAFGMKGGGMQHKLPLSVRELVNSGHLKVAK
ncbi:TNT domain-containing protein [Glaciecola sp. 1036]|uniref:TNT domain-containing protein n=1 Tax=Alteromonadaceae TaxID=72275 RepID=UPI003D035359